MYNSSQISNCSSDLPPGTTGCQSSPWWDVHNAGHGLETSVIYYEIQLDTAYIEEIKQITNSYAAVCPPSGVGGDGSGNGDLARELVSELDQGANPVVDCDVQLTQSVTQARDGSSSAASDTEAYNNYDAYGHVTRQTSTVNGGGGSPTTTVSKIQYSPISTLAVPAPSRPSSNPPDYGSQEGQWTGGVYMTDLPTYSDTENGSGVQSACDGTAYNGQGEAAQQSQYAACAPAPSGQLLSTTTYDASGNGNAVGTTDPDGHAGCSTNNGSATSCTTYDSTKQSLTTAATNALGQTSSVTYNTTANGGYGQWPVTTTDANNQTTSYTYDALGRMLTTTAPGEAPGVNTTTTTYANWCSGTGAQTPCAEVDTTQRLDSSGDTVVSRSFYDGAGRLAETRASSPGGQDDVQYTLYDAMGRAIAASIHYFVGAYTGAAGASAYSIPDTSQAVTSSTYDGLGRATSVTDPDSYTTSTAYSMVCSPAGTNGITNGDTGCYEQAMVTDANAHEHGTLSDAWGRAIYDQAYTGGSAGSYALYTTTKTTYDTAGRVISVLEPDGVATATYSYDTAGRLLASNDPDRGYEYYCYDANGNQTLHADARSSGGTYCSPTNNAGTTYIGYDQLNRPIWRSTTNNQTRAYATWAYDSTTGGNLGIGRLTSESFLGGAGGTALGHGQYTYTYDARGQQTGQSITLGGSAYSFSTAYNDAGEPTSLTYSDGEVASYGYDGASGALTSLITQPAGGTATNMLLNITYNAAGFANGASVANGFYTFFGNYLQDNRLNELVLNKASTRTIIFLSNRLDDAAGNLLMLDTEFPGGTSSQGFCYDEQNRVTWTVGEQATGPCGIGVGATTLAGAAYGPGTVTYDALDRMATTASGTNVYGDPRHIHALTSMGPNYSASYDAAGNMTCRSTVSSSQCTTSAQNGQILSYDSAGRLVVWQDAPTNPSSTQQMAYDGEGNRVALRGQWGHAHVLLGQLEEISGSTLTKYFSAGGSGLPTAERVGTGGAIYYLASRRPRLAGHGARWRWQRPGAAALLPLWASLLQQWDHAHRQGLHGAAGGQYNGRPRLPQCPLLRLRGPAVPQRGHGQ